MGRSFRKRQVSRGYVSEERDLRRLLVWLILRQGQPFRTGHVNRALYPHYDKAKTKRKEASPGLLLLQAARRKGWVECGPGHGRWADIRGRATIGDAMKGAR